MLTKEGRENLTTNIAEHLVGAQEFIQKRAVGNFGKADPVFGRTIQEKMDKIRAKKQVGFFVIKYTHLGAKVTAAYLRAFLLKHKITGVLEIACDNKE